MILIIDNYDSFTYNLYQQVESLGHKCEVFKNDELTLSRVKELNPEKIIISPGPGRPENSGISIKIVQHFYTHIPILGVCLGHQAIGQLFGSNVIGCKKILHGKTSQIFHKEEGLFKDIQNPFTGMRYHSLCLEKVPKNFILTAHTEENEIMAMRHKNHPLYSMQFHPESFLTTEGNKIIKNFLDVRYRRNI